KVTSRRRQAVLPCSFRSPLTRVHRSAGRCVPPLPKDRLAPVAPDADAERFDRTLAGLTRSGETAPGGAGTPLPSRPGPGVDRRRKLGLLQGPCSPTIQPFPAWGDRLRSQKPVPVVRSWRARRTWIGRLFVRPGM